jgi:hypothetical protein
MKTILLSTLFSVLLCTKAWSHAGHDAPTSMQAPHLGEVKCTENHCLELVVKGDHYTIYVYDHNLQPILLTNSNGVTRPSPVQVTAALQLPNAKKQTPLPLVVDATSALKLEGQLKAPDTHRYFVNVDVVEKTDGKKATKHTLKFQVEV